MDIAYLKYFDNLDAYGETLARELKIDDLCAKFKRWRRNGIEDPESVGSGCSGLHPF